MGSDVQLQRTYVKAIPCAKAQRCCVEAHVPGRDAIEARCSRLSQQAVITAEFIARRDSEFDPSAGSPAVESRRGQELNEPLGPRGRNA